MQNKARMLRALYERLDRLQDAVPAVEATTSVFPLIVARRRPPRRLGLVRNSITAGQRAAGELLRNARLLISERCFYRCRSLHVVVGCS
ncbi:hypothetical protein [Actinacidiphila oryziradicis]|uniref:Uncharacterized protein n=1 Tax=Actinacidiphila oryziradicis TaxID=2571141 RepID=A0A4U0RT77_9ACTN|nr:hypothetical protein [Actinacidiphila oryziradicis]TJZ99341.1 hypothetical protein FCI23_46145 [Actinacidiphila oryziradicis]